MYQTTVSHHQSRQGFIALIVVLIVAAVGLTIGISASLHSIEVLQSRTIMSTAEQASAAAAGCVEIGLESLRIHWVSVSATLPLSEQQCILTVVVDGAQATVTGQATTRFTTQRVTAVVSQPMSVISWQKQ